MLVDIKDRSLHKEGRDKIEWALRTMPVLTSLRKEFAQQKPFQGEKISACLHMTTETAALLIALNEGGGEVYAAASNLLSTQDDVVASLVEDYGISVMAIKGESEKQYYHHISSILEVQPTLTIDDGCDLVTTLHQKFPSYLPSVKGGTEETTTGILRLRRMAREKVLAYPILAVNDAQTKHLFDNRFGTGQSTMDAFFRSTNRLIAGSYFVVAGFGDCGRGLCEKAHGLGAKVIVTEINPIKALEAAMMGYLVMPMDEAARIGNFFCTVTGNKHVIGREHFLKMQDGAIIANSGHFNSEIDVNALDAMANASRVIRPFLKEYQIGDKKIYLLADGRLVNLSAAEGHPSSVMDMSFSAQALSLLYIKEHYLELSPGVHPIPVSIDERISREKLKALGITIDTLTPLQEQYLQSWTEGT